MKALSLLICLFAMNAQAANVKREITRTAQSPAILKMLAGIPLGHEVCEVQEVERCHNPKADCENSCTGTSSECWSQCIAETSRDVCETTNENVCEWEQTSTAGIELDLKIDSRAILTGSEKEEFEVKADFNNKTRLIDLRIKVDSKVHKYTYPSKLSIQPDTVTVIDFSLR